MTTGACLPNIVTQVLPIEDIGRMHELVVRTFDQAQMLPSPANAVLRYCSHLCP